MKTICCCIVGLALVLLCTSTAFAGPSDEMMSSPLFKTSLEKSIDKLEGKAQEQPLYADAGGGKTAAAECKVVNRPLTQQSTCSPSWCGGTETCEGTCYGSTCSSTCSGQSTCYNTCASTCWNTCGSQSTCTSTCSSTCVPGNCVHYNFSGTVYWVDYWYWYYGNFWVFPGYYGQLVNANLNNVGGYWGVTFGSENIGLGAFSINNGAYSGGLNHTPWTSGYSVGAQSAVWWYGVGVGAPVPVSGATTVSSAPQANNYVNVYVPVCW